MNNKEQTGGNPWVPFIGAFALVLAVTMAFWFSQIRGQWAAAGDEFALFANSAHMFHPHPSYWFTRGYRDYLTVYPELTSARSNFIRPVANIKYYLESWVYGEHWSWYMITNFLIFATLVATVVYLGAKHLRIRSWQLWVVGVLAFLSPAFEIYSHRLPNACLDLLGATFVAAGLCFLLDYRFLLAFLCFSMGVFTKETTHFAPFAASLSLLLFGARPFTTRVKAYIALFPLPVLALYVLRRIDFGKSGQSGVYVFQGIQSKWALMKMFLQGFRNWPFRIYAGTILLPQSGPSIHRAHLVLALFSCLFWILILRALFSTFRDFRRSEYDAPETGVAFGSFASGVTALLFLLGSLALPCLLNLTPRFGGLTFPFIGLFGIWYINHTSSRPLRVLWGMCLITLFVASLQARLDVFTELDETHHQWALDRSYLATARSAPAGTLLLVDDMSGFDAGTEWFRIFSRYPGTMIRVDSLAVVRTENCTLKNSTIIRENSTTVRIDFPTGRVCHIAVLSAIDKLPPEIWHRDLGGLSFEYLSDSQGIRSVIVRSHTTTPVWIMQSDSANKVYHIVQSPAFAREAPKIDQVQRTDEPR